MLNATVSDLIASEEKFIRDTAYFGFQMRGFDRYFAEESAQEVICRVLINAASSESVCAYLASAFDDGETRKSTRARFQGWLRKIVRNEVSKISDLSRNRARRYSDSLNASGLLGDGDDDAAESAGDASLPLGTIADPRTLLLAKEQEERLTAALAELDERERDMMRAFASGLPQVEIAESLGMSQVQVTRAKGKIFGKIRANMAE